MTTHLDAIEKQVGQEIAQALAEGSPIDLGIDPPEPPENLTIKQCRFADVYSLRLTSAADAYRMAYDTRGMKAKVVRNEASELLHHPGVAMRIHANVRALRAELLTSAVRLRAWTLDRLIHEATTADQAGARIRGLELIGRVPEVGLFEDTGIDDTGLESKDADALRAELMALLAKAHDDDLIDVTPDDT